MLRHLQVQQVSVEEMEQVKQFLLNSFVFEFDSTQKIVNRRAIQELLGYPLDYDSRFALDVASLSPEEILRVARNRWRVEDFVVVVVGNDKSYQSVKNMRDDPQAILHGYPLQRMFFKEHLVKT